MSRGLLVVAIGGLVAGAVLAGLLLGSPRGEPDHPTRFGFNNNAVVEGDADPRQAAELIAAGGGEIDRVQVDWSRLEPQPGQFEFATYDAIYEADIAAGIQPLFIFGYAPAWAAATPCEPPATCHSAPSAEHVDDAARAAARLAARYPRAAAIEIWNEPNTPYFWAPAADPGAYAELLRQSYEAIKASAPSTTVLGGSMSSSPASAPGLTAAEFLRGIYESGGGEAMDAISVHSYPQSQDSTGASALPTVDSVRAVRDEYGEGDTPLWITETGYTTIGPEAMSEELQGPSLVAVGDELAGAPDVEAVLIHTLVDPDRGPLNPETGFGVLDGSLTPKPAYCDLSEAWGEGAGC